jgi:hypothetical protein
MEFVLNHNRPGGPRKNAYIYEAETDFNRVPIMNLHAHYISRLGNYEIRND